MRYELIGRGLRALRHRGGLRQQDVAERAHLSRTVISDLEHGRIEHHSLAALVSAAHALGATLRIDLAMPGGDLHRLLDADHAWLQAEWAGLLQAFRLARPRQSARSTTTANEAASICSRGTRRAECCLLSRSRP